MNNEVNDKKSSRIKYVVSAITIISSTLSFLMLLFGDNSILMQCGLLAFVILMIDASIICFWSAKLNLKRYQFFLKSYNINQLVFLTILSFAQIFVCLTFALLNNLWLLTIGIVPILVMAFLFFNFLYYNYDSKILLNKRNCIYLGVAVKNHYMYNGVDIFSKNNATNVKTEPFVLLNPFNADFKYISKNLFYVAGKDYKFYIGTYALDKLYSLVYLMRKKDARRMYVNLNYKQDYELNKQIYLAYCADKLETGGDFIYAQNNEIRYKVKNINDHNKSQSSVLMEQNLEIPSINSKNEISTWFSEGELYFDSRSEADEFVKFALNQFEYINSQQQNK